MESVSRKLYTAEQVRRLDACAIEQHGIPGYELMTLAGRAVTDVAMNRFPAARNWLVLCGSGNNGGDGYVIARLARENGVRVTVCSLSPVECLRGDAATAARDYLDAGGEIHAWPPREDTYDLVVDALLGTGLDREVTGRYGAAIEAVNGMACPVVAVDIPSGLNADTGTRMGLGIEADLTVSFIGLKRGLVTADGPDCCGELMFDDLNTPAEIHACIQKIGILLRENIIAKKLNKRIRNSHKGSFGHVLTVGGNRGMGGAVHMAGEAALRAGAGLSSVATHPDHATVLNVGRPELMVSAVAGAAELGPLLERATVLAAGPGLGQGDWAGQLLEACLASHLPLVLDADGLNLVARRGFRRRDWIITPHPAEAARLAGKSTAEVQADRVGAALELAVTFNAVVVLKGCGTVVADPQGNYGICALGNPGMATGGSGDVLTGVIAALRAQGLNAWDAATVGVVAHAAAGDMAAKRGERGLLASDITYHLPAVLNP